tara:strand:- start:1025 stop:1240 length:216 start_codon:yes stop_codon:yes gene_type:complete
VDQVLPHQLEHQDHLDRVGLLAVVVVPVLTKHFQMQEEELVVEDLIMTRPLHMVVEEMVLLVVVRRCPEQR